MTADSFGDGAHAETPCGDQARVRPKVRRARRPGTELPGDWEWVGRDERASEQAPAATGPNDERLRREKPPHW